MLDYRERRQFARNKPKNRGASLLVSMVIGGLILVFGLGFVSGWFAGKHVQESELSVPPQVPADKGAGGKSAAAVGGNLSGSPLTFYETLAKGGRAVIGTGINPPKTDEPVTSGGAAGLLPPAAGRAQEQSAAVTEKEAVAGKPADKKQQTDQIPRDTAVSTPSAKFTVQVASHRDKSEAVIVRDRLVAKGFPAFVIESNLNDKGIWYRVRIGKGLEQADARNLAAKAGMGAVVIPE